MDKQIISGKKNSLLKWNTKDLLVTAVLGIVFGLVSLPLIWVFITIGWLTGPIGSRVIVGIFFIAGLIAPYIIRRPGTALIAQFFASLVQIPFSPYGWMILIMVITNGLPCELMFLATRYKKFSLPFMMFTGAVVSIPGYFMHAFTFGYFALSPSIIIGALLIQVLSGALLGGWLSKSLADAVAKTGVLSTYSVGKEQQEEV